MSNLQEPIRNFIINKLKSLGFEQNGDVFTKQIIAHEPGAVMIINGQKYEQPGRQYVVTFKFELICTGHIEPPHEDIEWVGIELSTPSQEPGLITILGEAMEGFYSNDHQLFEYICNRLGLSRL